MLVNYSPALAGLVQQVRQLVVMGYNVPPHILDTAELAKQFMRQARALQQVNCFLIWSHYILPTCKKIIKLSIKEYVLITLYCNVNSNTDWHMIGITYRRYSGN